MDNIISKLKNDIHRAYVIAEVGHNHQGDLEKCKKIFQAAKYAGADAVKLQKRNNRELFTKKFYNTPYLGRNSYAKTYGEHREFLEFNESQYLELKDFAKDLGIDFFATAFDFSSLEFLENIDLPVYKIASADLINTPLLKEIALTGKSIVMSTGGGTLEDIERAVDIISPINENLIILHCTASYPCEVDDMHLNAIPMLKKHFPDRIIGLSDHENGIDAASVAYMLGARVFEKHFTLNRAWKGTDQSFSLEPEGLRRMVRNLNRINRLLGVGNKLLLDCEKDPLHKMYKSLVASRPLKAGCILKKEDISIKSPGGGIPPYKLEETIGMKLLKDLNEDDFITDNLLGE